MSEDWPVSEWLRLSVGVGGAYIDVLLDEKAVRVLRKDFGRWLKLDKAIAGGPCGEEVPQEATSTPLSAEQGESVSKLQNEPPSPQKGAQP